MTTIGKLPITRIAELRDVSRVAVYNKIKNHESTQRDHLGIIWFPKEEVQKLKFRSKNGSI